MAQNIPVARSTKTLQSKIDALGTYPRWKVLVGVILIGSLLIISRQPSIVYHPQMLGRGWGSLVCRCLEPRMDCPHSTSYRVFANDFSDDSHDCSATPVSVGASTLYAHSRTRSTRAPLILVFSTL